MASDIDFAPLQEQIARETSIVAGVIAYLNGLPSGTTLAEAVAVLKKNNDDAEAALSAHVPPAPPVGRRG